MRYFRSKNGTVIISSLDGHSVRIGEEWHPVPDSLVPQALARECEERITDEEGQEKVKSPPPKKDISDFLRERKEKEEREKQAEETEPEEPEWAKPDIPPRLLEIMDAMDKLDAMISDGKDMYGKLKIMTASGGYNALVVGQVLGYSVTKDQVKKAMELKNERIGAD